mmetsp:Transcript_32321/g.82372  ORF Transcript_32321/g.82372 Transcript_32321/m.82372 type:complete len:240 (+) Transcript_32321:176-895(+)
MPPGMPPMPPGMPPMPPPSMPPNIASIGPISRRFLAALRNMSRKLLKALPASSLVTAPSESASSRPIACFRCFRSPSRCAASAVSTSRLGSGSTACTSSTIEASCAASSVSLSAVVTEPSSSASSAAKTSRVRLRSAPLCSTFWNFVTQSSSFLSSVLEPSPSSRLKSVGAKSLADWIMPSISLGPPPLSPGLRMPPTMLPSAVSVLSVSFRVTEPEWSLSNTCMITASSDCMGWPPPG